MGLAKMMGGTLWAESDGEGRGSTFHFSVQLDAAQTTSRFFPTGEQVELTKRRILIVDDNATNRLILTRQTQSWGMHPVAIGSPLEALSLLQSGNIDFDAAILDMQMPEMDGLTLAREIKRISKHREMPLMMLSSIGKRSEDVNDNLFAAYLTKPIKPSPLFDSLVTIFGSRPRKVLQTEKQAFDRGLAERHPLRILLAEDNPVNQKVAIGILGKLGYRADVAANGIEVLQALKRQPYDVVLLDMQMPEMDGEEAARHILHDYPNGRRPRLVAMTANALEGDRERYLASGMNDYVSKPVRVEELQRALEETRPLALELRQLQATKELT
jgi:CheY-like chemotaxis protein